MPRSRGKADGERGADGGREVAGLRRAEQAVEHGLGTGAQRPHIEAAGQGREQADIGQRRKAPADAGVVVEHRNAVASHKDRAGRCSCPAVPARSGRGRGRGMRSRARPPSRPAVPRRPAPASRGCRRTWRSSTKRVVSRSSDARAPSSVDGVEIVVEARARARRLRGIGAARECSSRRAGRGSARRGSSRRCRRTR